MMVTTQLSGVRNPFSLRLANAVLLGIVLSFYFVWFVCWVETNIMLRHYHSTRTWKLDDGMKLPSSQSRISHDKRTGMDVPTGLGGFISFIPFSVVIPAPG